MKSSKSHMRVMAGRIKGKLIECPTGDLEIRPMTSKVKEALFNIIGDCTGMIMLDMFTGSGNISIEAYSHGLENADLVEMDRTKKFIIEKNLKNAGFSNAHLYITDALLFCKQSTKQYDFIMLDPPFKWDKNLELLSIIDERNLLMDNGFLVIHLPKKSDLPEQIGRLECYDIRKYGINKLMFYERLK